MGLLLLMGGEVLAEGGGEFGIGFFEGWASDYGRVAGHYVTGSVVSLMNRFLKMGEPNPVESMSFILEDTLLSIWFWMAL